MSDSNDSRRRRLRRLSAASLSPALVAAEPQAAAPHGARVYDILDFGAKGDGQTLNTRALQDAIDACHTRAVWQEVLRELARSGARPLIDRAFPLEQQDAQRSRTARRGRRR